MRLLDTLISALSAVTAVALVYAAEWLNAFGPEFVANGWSGNALQLGLWLGAGSIVVFGSVRYFRHRVEMVGSFFALGLALMVLPSAIDASVLVERGRTTTCTVLRVHKRVERRTDSNGNTDTQVYYDHTLSCDTTRVRSMTTGDEPEGEPGQRVAVIYDPKQRLGPRPADEVTTPRGPLRVTVIALAVAAVLRGISELRGRSEWSDGFFSPKSGLERVKFGVTVFGIGLAWLFLIFATMHAAGSLRDHLLGWFGITQRVLRKNGWVRWPVRISSWVVFAVVFRYAAVLGAKICIRLLGVFRFLDPGGEIRALLADLDTGFTFSIGGLSLSFDGGFPGVTAVKNLVTRRSARHRRRTP